MKFSVVIPCYNSSSSIEAALDSLVNQTFKDFEVVIIDDASSDISLTMAIADRYQASFAIKFLKNSYNMNGAYSRNRGIEIAEGEFIAFLDSDDVWVPDRLETALKILEPFPDKDQILIYGRFELIRNHSTGALLPLRGIRKAELVSEYVFAACQQMQTSTFVCSSKLAKTIMFDEALNRHQDSDFAMRVQRAGAHIIFQSRKCSSYIFKSDDLRRRIETGRINSEFCGQWLKEKEQFFSKSAVAGYKISVFSRILYVEGYFVKSLLMLFKSLRKVGFRNILDLLLTKILILYKSRIGF
jgi:glycosyltransferase involved in cell wall biosynthesis